MSKPIDQASLGFIPYSLLEDIANKNKEMDILEKKILLANSLLSKVSNEIQSKKLIDKIQDCTEKKESLSKLVTEMMQVQAMITECILIFNFFKNLHKIVIEKINFEKPGENISLNLVNNLREEEARLYETLINKDCLGVTSNVLGYFPYQVNLEAYTTNFYEKIPGLSDDDNTYNKTILTLQVLRVEFDNFYGYFAADYFNVDELTAFLKANILAPLPSSAHCLVGLRACFFYNILLHYLKLNPVSSSFDQLQNLVQFECSIANYNSFLKVTLIDKLYVGQRSLDEIEQEFNGFMGKKTKEIKEDTNTAFIFYKTLKKKVIALDELIEDLNNKYRQAIKIQQLLLFSLDEKQRLSLLKFFNEQLELNFVLDKNINRINTSCYIGSNKEAVNYLYHLLCKCKNIKCLNEKVQSYINTVFAEGSNKLTTFSDTQCDIYDLIEFSYFYFFTLKFPSFNYKLIHFKNKLLYAEIFTLNVFLIKKIKIIDELHNVLSKKIDSFFVNKLINQDDFFTLKKTLLEEIEFIQELIEEAIKNLMHTKVLEEDLLEKNNSNQVMPLPDKKNLLEELNTLNYKKKLFNSKCEAIKKHELVQQIPKQKKRKKNKTTKNFIKEVNMDKFNKNFYSAISLLLIHFSKCRVYLEDSIKNGLSFNKNCLQDQQFSSAKGQIISEINNLNKILQNLVGADSIKNNLSLKGLQDKINELKDGSFLNNEKNEEVKLTACQQAIQECFTELNIIIQHMIDKYSICNKNASDVLVNLNSLFIMHSNSTRLLSKEIKFNKKFPKNYSILKQIFNLLKELIRAIRFDEDEQMAKLASLVMTAEAYQNNFFCLKEKINLMSLSAVKPSNPKVAISNKHLKQEAIASNAVKENSNSQGEYIERSIDAINPSTTIVEVKPVCMQLKNLNVIDKADKQEIIKEEKAEDSDIVGITLEVCATWDTKFDVWKYEKNTQLFKFFHLIENSSLSDLNNTKAAFLKCLNLYKAELIGKKSNFISHENKVWLDNTLLRITACRELVLRAIHIFQTINYEEIDHPRSLQKLNANSKAELESLLVAYLKSTLKYIELKKKFSFEKNKKDERNRNFIKKTREADSLAAIEEGKIIPSFSDQIDKLSNIKIAIEQERESIKWIITKLHSILDHESVRYYISLFGLNDEVSLDINSDNNQYQFQPQPSISYLIPSTIFYVPQTFEAATHEIYPIPPNGSVYLN